MKAGAPCSSGCRDPGKRLKKTVSLLEMRKAMALGKKGVDPEASCLSYVGVSMTQAVLLSPTGDLKSL